MPEIEDRADYLERFHLRDLVEEWLERLGSERPLDPYQFFIDEATEQRRCGGGLVMCQNPWCGMTMPAAQYHDHLITCDMEDRWVRCVRCDDRVEVNCIFQHRLHCRLQNCPYCGEVVLPRMLAYCPYRLRQEAERSNRAHRHRRERTLQLHQLEQITPSGDYAPLLIPGSGSPIIQMGRSNSRRISRSERSTSSSDALRSNESSSVLLDPPSGLLNNYPEALDDKVTTVQKLWRRSLKAQLTRETLFASVWVTLDSCKEGPSRTRYDLVNAIADFAARHRSIENGGTFTRLSARPSLASANQSSLLMQSRVGRADADEICIFDEPDEHGAYMDSTSLEHLGRLCSARQPLRAKTVMDVVVAATKVLNLRPLVQQVSIPQRGDVVIVGDLHGQMKDLCYLLQLLGNPSKDSHFIFNGDFIDRGPYGTEVIVYVFALLCTFPRYVYINRGNHEDYRANAEYGFLAELHTKYESEATSIHNLLIDSYQAMPLMAVIDKRFLVVHGGVPREPCTLDEIEALGRVRDIPVVEQVTREDRLLADILWNDPVEKYRSRQLGPRHEGLGWRSSKRGCGAEYTHVVTERFLKDNQLEMVIRSHDVKPSGFEVIHNNTTVTVFSASNYGGAAGNRGAVAILPKVSKQPVFRTWYVKEETSMYIPVALTIDPNTGGGGTDAENGSSSPHDVKAGVDAHTAYVAHLQASGAADVDTDDKEDSDEGKRSRQSSLQLLLEGDEFIQAFCNGYIAETENAGSIGGTALLERRRSSFSSSRRGSAATESPKGPLSVQLQVGVIQEIRELIFLNRYALLSTFSTVDEQRAGIIYKVEWCAVMERVLKLNLPWYFMCQFFTPRLEVDGVPCVEYVQFLLHFDSPFAKQYQPCWQRATVARIFENLDLPDDILTVFAADDNRPSSARSTGTTTSEPLAATTSGTLERSAVSGNASFWSHTTSREPDAAGNWRKLNIEFKYFASRIRALSPSAAALSDNEVFALFFFFNDGLSGHVNLGALVDKATSMTEALSVSGDPQLMLSADDIDFSFAPAAAKDSSKKNMLLPPPPAPPNASKGLLLRRASPTGKEPTTIGADDSLPSAIDRSGSNPTLLRRRLVTVAPSPDSTSSSLIRVAGAASNSDAQVSPPNPFTSFNSSSHDSSPMPRDTNSMEQPWLFPIMLKLQELLLGGNALERCSFVFATLNHAKDGKLSEDEFATLLSFLDPQLETPISPEQGHVIFSSVREFAYGLVKDMLRRESVDLQQRSSGNHRRVSGQRLLVRGSRPDISQDVDRLKREKRAGKQYILLEEFIAFFNVTTTSSIHVEEHTDPATQQRFLQASHSTASSIFPTSGTPPQHPSQLIGQGMPRMDVASVLDQLQKKYGPNATLAQVTGALASVMNVTCVADITLGRSLSISMGQDQRGGKSTTGQAVVMISPDSAASTTYSPDFVGFGNQPHRPYVLNGPVERRVTVPVFDRFPLKRHTSSENMGSMMSSTASHSRLVPPKKTNSFFGHGDEEEAEDDKQLLDDDGSPIVGGLQVRTTSSPSFLRRASRDTIETSVADSSSAHSRATIAPSSSSPLCIDTGAPGSITTPLEPSSVAPYRPRRQQQYRLRGGRTPVDNGNSVMGLAEDVWREEAPSSLHPQMRRNSSFLATVASAMSISPASSSKSDRLSSTAPLHRRSSREPIVFASSSTSDGGNGARALPSIIAPMLNSSYRSNVSEDGTLPLRQSSNKDDEASGSTITNPNYSALSGKRVLSASLTKPVSVSPKTTTPSISPKGTPVQSSALSQYQYGGGGAKEEGSMLQLPKVLGAQPPTSTPPPPDDTTRRLSAAARLSATKSATVSGGSSVSPRGHSNTTNNNNNNNNSAKDPPPKVSPRKKIRTRRLKKVPDNI